MRWHGWYRLQHCFAHSLCALFPLHWHYAGRLTLVYSTGGAGTSVGFTASIRLPCPLGRFAAGASNCTLCPAGTYGNTTGSSAGCTGCSAGRFGAVEGMTSSDCSGLCSVGTYSTLGANACIPCPAGRYGNSSGLTSAACSGNCAAGTYSYAGSANCSAARVSPGERQGLVNLYLSTNGSGWTGIGTTWASLANASVDPCFPSGLVGGITCSSPSTSRPPAIVCVAHPPRAFPSPVRSLRMPHHVFCVALQGAQPRWYRHEWSFSVRLGQHVRIDVRACLKELGCHPVPPTIQPELCQCLGSVRVVQQLGPPQWKLIWAAPVGSIWTRGITVGPIPRVGLLAS